MTSYAIVPAQNIIGLVYSTVALAGVVPICFLFRNYFRFLDFLQIMFALAVTFGSQTATFSNQLQRTWLNFIPNFLTFCQTGDFVCKSGGLLSFTVCLVGAMIILWIIVHVEKCRRPQLRYEPIYTLMKGLIRWTYFPLMYYALSFLITEIKLHQNLGTTMSFTGDVTARIVVIAVLFIFPFFQLLYYKLIQKEDDNIWVKWLQLFSYLRLSIIAMLINVSQIINKNITGYFIYGPLVAYAAIYFVKGQFPRQFLGRALFLIGELMMIAIFSLFIFKPQFIHDYDLDLLLISGVLAIDIFYYILLLVRLLKGSQGGKVNPEETSPIRQPGYKQRGQIPIVSEQSLTKNNYERPTRNKR